MKRSKFILMGLTLVILTLGMAACDVQMKTSESVTDADGNTVTTSTTYDNGEVTTETTESSAEDEEYAEDGEEASGDNDGVPEGVTEFIGMLETAIANQGVNATLNAPQDQGDGQYKITTNSELISFAVQTDGRSAQGYTATAATDDQDAAMAAFTLLFSALLEGDELNDVSNAIASGESPVESSYYTFTSVSGEADGAPFTTLVAEIR